MGILELQWHRVKGFLGDVLIDAANLFRWDSTNSRLGLRQATPTSTLHLGGSLGLPVRTVTGDRTLDEGDYYVRVDTGGTYPPYGTINVTLPAASGCLGRQYLVRQVNTGNAVVKRSGSDVIGEDGVTSFGFGSVTVTYLFMAVASGQWDAIRVE